jgi:hypothetical protein
MSFTNTQQTSFKSEELNVRGDRISLFMSAIYYTVEVAQKVQFGSWTPLLIDDSRLANALYVTPAAHPQPSATTLWFLNQQK